MCGQCNTQANKPCVDSRMLKACMDTAINTQASKACADSRMLKACMDSAILKPTSHVRTVEVFKARMDSAILKLPSYVRTVEVFKAYMDSEILKLPSHVRTVEGYGQRNTQASRDAPSQCEGHSSCRPRAANNVGPRGRAGTSGASKEV